MVDEELRAAIEQLGERLLPVLGVERVLLVDRHPRQLLPLLRDLLVELAQLALPLEIVVLKGSVQIEVEDGPTLELGVGDMASMPKGAVTTWHPSPDFEEIWIYH